MEKIKLHEGELNIMELLWSNKSLAAKDIAKIIKDYVGWEKNTTYTVIKRLIDKKAILRTEPGFICSALISKQEIQQSATEELIYHFYDNKLSEFISDYLGKQEFSNDDIKLLKQIIKNYE